MTSHNQVPTPIEKLINNLAQSIHGSLTSASATEFIALAVDAYNGHSCDRSASGDRVALGDNFVRAEGMTGARFSQPSAARGRRFSRGGIINEIVPADNPPEQLGGQVPYAHISRGVGMALTAEQVEDVRTLVGYGEADYSEAFNRLRALTHVDRLAEAITNWTLNVPAPVDPVDGIRNFPRCGHYLDEARCTRRIHDGDHEVVQGDEVIVWPAGEPDPAPAEEDRCDLYAETESGDARQCTRRDGHTAHHHIDPPAPTETESWPTWQEVPEGRTVRAKNRHTYTKRDGILCIGTSTMKSCMATSTQHLAPFVAAEG